MGLQDRDYMRERPGRKSPFTAPARQVSTWRVAAVLLMISGALFVGFDWLLVHRGSPSPVEKMWNSIQPKSQTTRSPSAVAEPSRRMGGMPSERSGGLLARRLPPRRSASFGHAARRALDPDTCHRPASEDGDALPLQGLQRRYLLGQQPLQPAQGPG